MSFGLAREILRLLAAADPANPTAFYNLGLCLERQEHFEEAAAAFLDPLGVEKPELRTSGSEERFIRVAHSPRGQLLLTIFSERGRRIRIISSRRATRREVKQYEEGI